MTTSTERFLAALTDAVDVQWEKKLAPGTERLLRLARRGFALEQALRSSDPGHDVTAAVVEPTQDRTKSVSDFGAMGRALLASTGPFEPGVCRVCGCTRITACDVPDEERCGPGGSRACGWVDEDETLCDAPLCVEAASRSGQITLSPTDHHGSEGNDQTD